MESGSFLRFINVEGIPLALAIFIGGLILLRVVTRALDQLGERLTDRRLLFKQVSALVRFGVWFLLLLGTLSSVLELRSEALLAVAGSLGVAFGFAFKDLLASLMAGVILLFDRPFQVGDRVTIGHWYGEITEIGLRSVRLVTLDDNLVTVPNSNFLSEAVASANAGALDCMVVIDVCIAAAEDFARAKDLVEEAAFSSPWIYLEKPVVTHISDEFKGERYVTVIRLKAYVIDARFERTFASDVTQRVKAAFAGAGVRTPDAQYRDLELNQGREVPS